MARKAVAATLAAAVLFTLLVVADATVMAAQDNLASSSQTAHLESRELLLERSSAGVASLGVLAQVQSYLSSNPAECDGLAQYLAAISATSSTQGVDSGISYVANATAVEWPAGSQAPLSDNLTVVSPFAGDLPGALDLKEVLSIDEVGGGGSVSLERHETHALDVPIGVDSASSLCASTLGSLAAALSRSPCNATLEQAAFDSVLPGLTGEAAAQGFDLASGWGYAAACAVTYWIRLVEPGVAGVEGGFDWTVLGSGTTA